MTVQAELPQSSFTYAGGGLDLSFDWSFDRETELLVLKNDVALVYLSDYTVEGAGDPLGGSITLLATPTNGDVFVVRRRTVRERQTDYVQALTAAQLNRDFDRLWYALQEGFYFGSALSITIPADEYGNVTGLILPDAAGRALRTLTFDANGHILLLLTSTLLNDSFSSLPFITTLDEAADSFIVYDDSADGGARILVSNAIGSKLGDGRWRVLSGQALSSGTPALLELASATYDALQRGAFSVSTRTYTASAITRLNAHASVGCTIAQGTYLRIEIRKNGVTVAQGIQYNEITGGTQDYIVTATAQESLIAGDTITVYVTTSDSGRTVDSATSKTFLLLQELA